MKSASSTKPGPGDKSDRSPPSSQGSIPVVVASKPRPLVSHAASAFPRLAERSTGSRPLPGELRAGLLKSPGSLERSPPLPRPTPPLAAGWHLAGRVPAAAPQRHGGCTGEAGPSTSRTPGPWGLRRPARQCPGQCRVPWGGSSRCPLTETVPGDPSGRRRSAWERSGLSDGSRRPTAGGDRHLLRRKPGGPGRPRKPPSLRLFASLPRGMATSALTLPLSSHQARPPPRKARPEEIWGRGPRASPSTSCLVPPSPARGPDTTSHTTVCSPKPTPRLTTGGTPGWPGLKIILQRYARHKGFRAGGWGALGAGAALRSPGDSSPGRPAPPRAALCPPEVTPDRDKTTTVDHPTDSAELRRRRPSVPGTRRVRVRSACALPQRCHEPLKKRARPVLLPFG